MDEAQKQQLRDDLQFAVLQAQQVRVLDGSTPMRSPMEIKSLVDVFAVFGYSAEDVIDRHDQCTIFSRIRKELDDLLRDLAANTKKYDKAILLRDRLRRIKMEFVAMQGTYEAKRQDYERAQMQRGGVLTRRRTEGVGALRAELSEQEIEHRIDDLKRTHSVERAQLESFLNRLPEPHVKFSRLLLELKNTERNLAKLRLFEDAKNVYARADTLEADQRAKNTAAFETFKQTKRELLLAKQQEELMELDEKMMEKRYILMRTNDTQRRTDTQRMKNLGQDMRHAHSMDLHEKQQFSTRVAPNVRKNHSRTSSTYRGQQLLGSVQGQRLQVASLCALHDDEQGVAPDGASPHERRMATKTAIQTLRRAAQRSLATAPTRSRSLRLQARAPAAVAFAVQRSSHRSLSTAASDSANATQQKQDEAKTDAFANPETQILERALAHVNTHGWTVEALAAGATDIGYPSVAHGMFPRGAIELVEYFMDQCQEKLHETLLANTELLQIMPVTDRLKFGVRTRLQLLEPVLATWPQAMALGALPANVPTTMQKLAKISDEIWYFAGDQSTDASWYTKRAILTGIYASTELHLLSDQSPGSEATWAFLDRRVEETIALGEMPQNINDVAGMVTIGVQSLLSAVTSLAGPLSSEVIANSPLNQVPNPISAIGSTVAAGLASGLPGNPLTNAGAPASAPSGGIASSDLREIDQELEKLGGSQDESKPRQ